MNGESPVPQIFEPSTVATDAAMVRALRAERDYVNGQLDVLRARLNGMDEAAKVLHETVTRTPTDIQQAVGHLHSLMTEKFTSVGTQFAERDTRSERESRDNKIAVDAAFAAQKEIAAKQDESNAKAIEKSEKATEKIIDSLGGKIDDLKERVTAAEATRTGGRETTTGFYALISVLVGVSGLVLAAFLATH